MLFVAVRDRDVNINVFLLYLVFSIKQVVWNAHILVQRHPEKNEIEHEVLNYNSTNGIEKRVQVYAKKFYDIRMP